MLIDPKSSDPIFRQIANQLRRSIGVGIFKPGEMLPSLRALAIDIKVNPNTVQRAYDALEREGLVQTRRGIGVFVANTNHAKRTAAERQLATELSRCIQRGVNEGLTPEGMRVVFDSVMHQFLSEASR